MDGYNTALMYRKIAILEADLRKAKQALKEISEIEDRPDGGDWDEISEARVIANVVLRSME